MALSTGDILGTAGVTILLIAFAMNLLKKWSQDNVWYVLFNTVGGALAFASSIVIHFVPFIILEAIWTLVSLFALLKILFGKKSSSKTLTL